MQLQIFNDSATTIMKGFKVGVFFSIVGLVAFIILHGPSHHKQLPNCYEKLLQWLFEILNHVKSEFIVKYENLYDFVVLIICLLNMLLVVL